MRRALLLPIAGILFSVSGAAAETPLPVELIPAVRKPVKVEFTITGTIEAATTYSASFQSGGRLVRLDPQVGDKVLAGASIGAIDVTQQLAARDASKAGVEGAAAALDQAQKDYTRQAALLKEGIVTRAKVESANQTLVQARSALDQADARLTASETDLGNTELIVPEDSIVTSRNAEPGQVIGAGQPIVGLASMRERDAVFLVPDGSQPEAFIGRTIVLQSLDHDVEDLTAVISEVSPVVDAETGSIRVKARVSRDEDAGPALLGEAVEGNANMEEEAAFILPWNVITADEKGMAVWTVEPDSMKAVLTSVTVRRFTTDKAIISDGLDDGVLVVGEGSQLLYPGRVVRALAGEGS